MSNEKAQALEIAEQKMISKAVLLLINQYPDLKKVTGTNIASFNFLDKVQGISLFTSSGAIYLQKDIMGGFKAQYPFEIAVKKPTNSDKERMTLSDFLEEIAEYVTKNKAAIKLDDGRIIDRLEQTTVVNYVGRDGMSDIYRVGMQLVYKKE